MTPDGLAWPGSFSLDGAGWEAHGYLGEEWRHREGHMPHGRERDWIPATVPGSVLDDLRAAGRVPDPYVGRNSLLCEWVPERTWLYRKRFTLPRGELPPRVELRLEGLDYSGEVFVNGETLGRHEGTFVPVSREVRELLRPGADNLLAVVIDPAPPSEPEVGRTERVTVHKPRMSYGWDFCPRIVHVGIWDSVLLRATGPLRIDDAWLRAESMSDRAATVRAVVTVSGGGGEVEFAIGDSVARAALVDGRAELRLELPDAPRWWPNRLGAPALQEARVRALDAGGRRSDERTVRFGVRSVELAPNEGAPSDARGYTLVVNGRRTPIRGWNWVPLDACYGRRRPERLARLLDLAREAGVNLLRVWGGGLIERDDFYEACDERGILVWQEFSQSSSGVSSVPSRDPDFVERMRQEAESIVPRRRNHPSLAIWGGGNELTDEDGSPIDETHPVIATLADVVRRLDPGRAWLPSSPSGRAFFNRLDIIEADPDAQHDVHGPWEHQGPAEHYRLYNASTSLLHSEFGAEGMANRAALESLVPAADRWPADRTNPLYEHLGAWWNNAQAVIDWFGGDSFRREVDSLASDERLAVLRRCSQLLQADGLRYAVESSRRRWPRCAGTLPWQLNESFPNAWCTAAVDYYGRPKPAYWAVAAAYSAEPVGAVLERQALDGARSVPVLPWVLVERRQDEPPAPLRLRTRLFGGSGSLLGSHEQSVRVSTNRVSIGDRVDLSLPACADGDDDVLLLEVALVGSSDPPLTTNRYLLSRTADLAPLRRLGRTRLEVDHGSFTVRNVGERLAVGVEIEDARPVTSPGWPMFSMSPWFHLLPGESRSVGVRWPDTPQAERRLVVSAWNADAVEV